jgi:hypothetical protein
MGRFNFGKSDSSWTDSNTERRPSAVEAMDNATRRKSVDDHAVTGAGEITTKQSIIPVGELVKVDAIVTDSNRFLSSPSSSSCGVSHTVSSMS